MRADLKNKLVALASKLKSIKTARASESDVEEFLMSLLESESNIGEIGTFEEAGVMTQNKGLVFTYNGSKFEVTIVGYDSQDDEDDEDYVTFDSYEG